MCVYIYIYRCIYLYIYIHTNTEQRLKPAESLTAAWRVGKDRGGLEFKAWGSGFRVQAQAPTSSATAHGSQVG